MKNQNIRNNKKLIFLFDIIINKNRFSLSFVIVYIDIHEKLNLLHYKYLLVFFNFYKPIL